MADERYNFIIGMEFNPGDSVQRALRTGQDVREVLRSIFNEPISFGKIDTAGTMRQIEQFGASLRAELERQLRAGVESSALYKGLPTNMQGYFKEGHAEEITVGRGTPGLAEALQARISALRLSAEEERRHGTKESKLAAQKLDEEARLLAKVRDVEQGERAHERALGKQAAQGQKIIDIQEREIAEAEKAAAHRAEMNRTRTAIGALGLQGELSAGETDPRRLTRISAAARLVDTMNRVNAGELTGEKAISALATARKALLRAIESETTAEEASARRQSEINQTRGKLRSLGLLGSPLDDLLGGGADGPSKVTLARMAAESRFTDTMNKVNAGELAGERAVAAVATARKSLTAALDNEIEAERKLAASAQEQARRRTGAAGGAGGGGIRDDFMTGFRGKSDRPYAEQIGQAFKFSLFYGTAYKALFMLTQTLQQTLQEGIAFQQGMSDLAIATDKPKEELTSLAERLGQQAAAVGASPSQGVEVGARALGLYGLAGSGTPLSQQAYAAEISNQVVSKLSVGSKLSPVDLQTNIAAITQALGTGVAGQLQVADLDAYFTKKFGIAAGATFETVAQSASVGMSAGFSPEQIFAIAADLQSRTGQTPAAVGGYLAQIFSRGGQGSLTEVAGQYGLDTTQTLQQILAQLSAIYQQGTPNQQNQIAAAFGRGKIQNAAISLLTDFPEIQRGARSAEGGAAQGAFERSFQERMNNVGGQLALLGGDFKELAHLLGESGMLRVVGLGIEVLHQFLSATNLVLEEWNSLPGVIKDAAQALLLLAIASKAAAAAGLVGGLTKGGLSLLRGKGVEVAEGSLLARLAGSTAGPAEGSLISGGAGGLAAGAAEGGVISLGAGAIGAAALAAAPWAAAAAGVVALAALKKGADEINHAVEASRNVLTQTPAYGSTAGEYDAYAASLRNQAQSDREAGNFLSNMFGGNREAKEAAERLDAEAARTEVLARRQRQQEAAGARATQADVFGGFNPGDIEAGLKSITDQGGTAADQLRSLTAAIEGMGDAAADKATKIDTQELAGPLSEAVFGSDPNSLSSNLAREASKWGARITPQDRLAIGALTDSTYLTETPPPPQQLLPGEAPPISQDLFPAAHSTKVNDLYQALATDPNLQPDAIAKNMQAQLDQLGITSFSQLTPKLVDQISHSLAAGVDTSQYTSDPDTAKRIRDQIAASFTAYLTLRMRDFRKLIDGAVSFTPLGGQAVIGGLLQTVTDKNAALPTTAYDERIRNLRGALKTAKDALAKTDDPTGQTLKDMSTLRAELAQSQIDQLEALRKVAVQNAHSQAQATALGRAFVAREIRAVVRRGTRDQLASVIATAGKGAIATAEQVIDTALAAQRAALLAAMAMEAAATAALVATLGMDAAAGKALNDAQAEIERIQAEIKRLTGLKGSLQYATYSENPDQVSEDKGSGETAMERAAAAAAARAARSESPIAKARADILSARAAMAKAKKGTVEYYDALAQFYEARNQLTDAILDYRHNLGLLNIDITDPVAQANLAVRDAERKLRSDRGKGKDVRAADRVALRQAQADQEATAFQTRLETVQTAEQLGRISHAAYINYLQNESKRLNNIKDRTYQQQQELNQIDMLLKEAADQMQGQWNFGDIKLPTPYQVRRYIAARSGDTADAIPRDPNGGTHTTVHDTKIYVNGADTGMVRRIINEVVGHPGRTTTPAGRRR